MMIDDNDTVIVEVRSFPIDDVVTKRLLDIALAIV